MLCPKCTFYKYLSLTRIINHTYLHTYLKALYLRGTYCHKTSTRPSSCNTPRELTKYAWVSKIYTTTLKLLCICGHLVLQGPLSKDNLLKIKTFFQSWLSSNFLLISARNVFSVLLHNVFKQTHLCLKHRTTVFPYCLFYQGCYLIWTFLIIKTSVTIPDKCIL